MNILVITNSCSAIKYKSICEIRKNKIIEPQQKFFRLFIEGLGKNKECNVTVLSALPVSSSTVKRYTFKYRKEITNDGVVYHYLPFFNGKFSRYISLMISSWLFAKRWCQQNCGKEAVVIIDPLIPVIAIPSRKIAQNNGIKVAAVVTDLPTLSTNMKERKESFFKQICMMLYQTISDLDIHGYDFYIPLTESINNKVNIRNKPYCVVEGFADSGDHRISEIHENYIMYAGGVYVKYGVKALVEAFIQLNMKDIELYIFGEGTYVEELIKISEQNKNIKYMGCVSPEEVVEYEKRALLLVNPRPTDEDFAKFSFPSKIMEYLLSGTAVVSTKLLGIPDEYWNYMYKFDGFTPNDIKKKLLEILSQPYENIARKGLEGHFFAMQKKNNIVMANKIHQFLHFYQQRL